MGLPKCRMPCQYRTWGKYRQTATGKIILNKQMQPEGTCLGSPVIDESGKCTTFRSWEEYLKLKKESAGKGEERT